MPAAPEGKKRFSFDFPKQRFVIYFLGRLLTMSGVKPGAFLMVLALQRPGEGGHFLLLLVFSGTSKCVGFFY